MDLRFVCCLLLSVVLTGMTVADTSTDGKCDPNSFYSEDLGDCESCTICQKHPNTPNCNRCRQEDLSPNVWMTVAICSFCLTFLVVLISFGVWLHYFRSRSRSTTLSEPIEETAGPLYQGA
ncbi:uncharacterized protein LOC127529818 [Erpetoichthys calabaricus]|uniref:uncharacterized protein LOC127529818 n=1 Tax=Erpetoichthys calabaricus TaxID=27687 RepID=UPI002233EFA0|nr:uncharacterized protein LOC127529818 [Erpetoichthys calabaricus]